MRLHAPARSRPTGILVGVGFGTAIVGCFVASAFPRHMADARVWTLAAFVAAFSWLAGDLVAAVVTAGLAWLLAEGFLIDRYGQVRWHGVVEVRYLGPLVGAALFGVLLGLLTARRS